MEKPSPPKTGHGLIDLLAWPAWMVVWAISQFGVDAASIAADLAVAVGALAGAAVTLLRLYRMLSDTKEHEAQA